MSRILRDRSGPTLLLGALATITVLTVIVAASTSGAAFGTYNLAWDGASDLRDVADDVDTDHEVLLNASVYDETAANGTVSVVLSPETDYSTRDRLRLRSFVQRGGTLVVAEDYGPRGNTLLETVGASARFNGSAVRDERYNYQSPAFPVAQNVTSHPLTADVSQLTLNYGTVVEANNASVLVQTSEFAYLDRDGDGELDDNESLQRRPVVTVEQVGAGQVIAVSDPSLFINVMLERPGNQQFVTNLFDAHERVLLDYSHAGSQPPLTVAVLLFRDSLLLQLLVGVLGVGAIAVWLHQPSIGRGETDETGSTATPHRGFQDEEAILAYLREQHPDWEESRLRRVMRGIFTDDQQNATDE